MFDEIIKRNFNNTIIEYGLINGNNTILLIKSLMYFCWLNIIPSPFTIPIYHIWAQM